MRGRSSGGRPPRATLGFVAGLAGALLAGCAGVAARQPGAVPRIANLAVPAIAWANVPYEVTFDFFDPGADIKAVCFAWAWGDDRDEKCFPADVAGVTNGVYRWRLTTKQARLYYLTVFVRDAQGHRSNVLAKTLDVR